MQPGDAVVEYAIKEEDEDGMVVVLALTAVQDVVLVRQFGPGPEAILLELPAGVVEPDSSPAETAGTELPRRPRPPGPARIGFPI